MQGQNEPLEEDLSSINDFNFLVSNEDIPYLWQAEFLIYLIIFKVIIVLAYILSDISYMCILYCLILFLEILGFVAIKTFSLKLNLLYLGNLALNSTILLFVIIFRLNGESYLNRKGKAQLLVTLGLYVYEIYQIWVHLRFQSFLKVLRETKRAIYIGYMKDNYTGYFSC